MAELKQGSYTRTQGAPSSNTYPRFFTESVKDHVASAREGRDIFKPEERVEIIMPGISQLTKPVEKVSQEHVDRWPSKTTRSTLFCFNAVLMKETTGTVLTSVFSIRLNRTPLPSADTMLKSELSVE